MKINVGTKNPAKVGALKELIQDYPLLKNSEIFPKEVTSNVSNQPKSLDETMRGAMSRAKGSFSDCDFSFGIESGLMEVPHIKTGYMDVCVCAIYNGKDFFFGLSSAWEAPKKIADYILKEGLDMNEAALKAGLTNNPKVGSSEGLIGIMTKGRLTRKEYTKEAIRTALIHLEPVS